MTIADYNDVYNFWINTPGMGLNDIDDSRAGIEKYLERNPRTCFVAIEQNEIVGAILSGHDGRRGYIYHTAVSASMRKCGIGTALLSAAIKSLEAEGICKVALVVFSKNSIGNKFWEKRGFTVRKDLIYRNKAMVELKRIDT
ncbi:GNAT family N-acetyltransferase [Caproicibacterium amylolyticum]|uniref:GNAT family N-acetyltransferase n=2 Tax=Caproicibacterium amylolyticum TaxID=2766537 RepID=A0A7G9WLI3_9FIRM|nr:GNAT family N-acetyltransferase [Caproicibacterium amylolyticum]